MTVSQPRLIQTEPKCIRKFLDLYDQYVDEVVARVRQLDIDAVEADAIRFVDLKFSFNIKFLQFTIALKLLNDVTDYESL